MLTYTDPLYGVTFTVDRMPNKHYSWTISERGVELARSGRLDTFVCDSGLTAALALLLFDFAAYIKVVDPRNDGNEDEGLFPESCRNLAEALDAGIVSGWAEEVEGNH